MKPIIYAVGHSGAPPKVASPESITPARGRGFRARRFAAPRNDAAYDSNFEIAVLAAATRTADRAARPVSTGAFWTLRGLWRSIRGSASGPVGTRRACLRRERNHA